MAGVAGRGLCFPDKADYIIEGKIDLIRGEGNMVESVDFKAERKPDNHISVHEVRCGRNNAGFYDTVHKIVKKNFRHCTNEARVCVGCDFRFFCNR